MTTFGLPYIFDDRSGDVSNTEFNELYDRMFLGVASSSSSSSSSAASSPVSAPSSAGSSPHSTPPRSPIARGPRTLTVYEFSASAQPHRHMHRANYNNGGHGAYSPTSASRKGKEPAIVLDFAAPGASGGGVMAGTVLFVPQGIAMPMASWLRVPKSGLDPKTRLVRTFRCSDGEEYKWTHTANAEAEWACTTSTGYIAAQYNLRPGDEPRYACSSGNTLTVYEAYAHVVPELLAALVMVRYVLRYEGAGKGMAVGV